MSVDPADDCTFWYTNEYLAANGTLQLAHADRLVQVPELRHADRPTSRSPRARRA